MARLVLLLALCTVPCAAAAQPWADAVKAGDYRKAADLLHPIVFDLHQQAGQGDPAPARYLADLYARGRGVARDPIVACALAQLSDMADMNAPALKGVQDYSAYQTWVQQKERFVFQYCGRLSEHETKVAGRAFGCMAFNIPDGVITVGGQTIWVSLSGFAITEGADKRFLVDVGCPLRVARVRGVTLEPPADAAPGVTARQFVEVLTWQAARDEGDSRVKYGLTWQMHELRGRKIEPVATEQLYSVGKWSQTVFPSDFDSGFTVEMIRSGHVRWRLDGAPPKRGWIMLPDEEKR